MTDKTIRMPKKLLAKWLKALRSGEYKQARGRLYRPEICGFCCLGVLQHVASGGSVEAYNDGEYMTLPSSQWLRDNGIEFKYHNYDESRYPMLPPLNIGAVEANDRGIKFKRIADAIEACAEGY